MTTLGFDLHQNTFFCSALSVAPAVSPERTGNSNGAANRARRFLAKALLHWSYDQLKRLRRQRFIRTFYNCCMQASHHALQMFKGGKFFFLGWFQGRFFFSPPPAKVRDHCTSLAVAVLGVPFLGEACFHSPGVLGVPFLGEEATPLIHHI